MVMGQPEPLDFYMGPAPTLEELNLNYEEMGKRAMEANAPFAAQYKQFALRLKPEREHCRKLELRWRQDNYPAT
jgi:hypothetical protein